MQSRKSISLKSVLITSALALSFGTAMAGDEASAPASSAQAYTTQVVAQADTAADSFKQLDTNKDGFIDQKEASASSAVSQMFNDVDTNKDGKLSADEFNAAFKGAK